MMMDYIRRFEWNIRRLLVGQNCHTIHTSSPMRLVGAKWLADVSFERDAWTSPCVTFHSFRSRPRAMNGLKGNTWVFLFHISYGWCSSRTVSFLYPRAKTWLPSSVEFRCTVLHTFYQATLPLFQLKDNLAL